jgi:hypothetical protein
MGKMRIVKILFGKPEVRDQLEEIDVDGRTD